MMHRYADAIKTFVTILLFISRAKQFQTRSYDVVRNSLGITDYLSQKKSEQMYTLLAILLTICPKHIDEHVYNTLKQDYSEQVAAMTQHKEAEAFFSFACPQNLSFEGKSVWGNPRAIVAMMRQCNTVDMSRRSPSYEVRLNKYASRGYEVFVPTLKRNEVDPTVRCFLEFTKPFSK